MSSPHQPTLLETLRDAQRLGVLGSRPVEEVVAHAGGFVTALDGVTGRVLDLGSGGGVPGLVIAVERPDLHLTLLDRREKRTDLLRRAVARLEGAGAVTPGAVTVVHDDAVRFARLHPHEFDAVVARGFGPPVDTVRLGLALVRDAGPVVVSEPPSGDRWPDDLLVSLGATLERRSGVALFRRRG